MSVFEKQRWEIWNMTQHPYKHSLAEFSYTNNALPSGYGNVESALNYILAVLYPKTKDNVATPAALPLAGNDIGDYRIVDDDGDGRSAGYRWEQREGDASPQWYKVFDVDWSTDAILAAVTDVTQDLYFNSKGKSDLDENGDVILGLYAGQTVYGGNLANQNLTLNANSGDGVGPQTGYVQIESNFRPTTDNLFDLSTATERWKDAYFAGTLVVGDMTLASGSITDSSGQISFGDENLLTTGNITGAQVQGTSLVADDTINTLTLVPGSIIDTSGTISFGATNLATTGTLRAGVSTFVDNLQELVIDPEVAGQASITSTTGFINFDDENLITTGTLDVGNLTTTQLTVDNVRIDGNTISTLDVNGNLILSPNGTGVVDVQKELNTLDVDVTGVLSVTGSATVDNLSLNGNTLSTLAGVLNLDASVNVALLKDLLPVGSIDLGAIGSLFNDLFLSGEISNGTNSITMSDLLALRSTVYRDVARTQPAQNGDSLFYDQANNLWLASAPDTEIDHGAISGLGDDDHTQYMLLAGRSGGQDLIGGQDANDDLTLESTANATKGYVLTKDIFAPFTNASFSGTWSGIDLGDATHYFRDVYSKGEFRGFRFENFTSGTLPSASTQNVGRVVYATDNQKAYVDTGTAFKVLGVSKFVQDVAFDGVQLTADVATTGITDVRNAVWQLLDNANNFETLYVVIKKTSASNVRIETSIPLPAGSYRLIGIE